MVPNKYRYLRRPDPEIILSHAISKAGHAKQNNSPNRSIHLDLVFLALVCGFGYWLLTHGKSGLWLPFVGNPFARRWFF